MDKFNKKYKFNLYKQIDSNKIHIIKTELITENNIDITDLEFLKSGKFTEDQANEIYWLLSNELNVK